MKISLLNLRNGDFVKENSNAFLIVGLSFFISVCQGGNIQSIGITASKIIKEFHLSSSQMGMIFGAGTLGMLLGALVGGRFADIFGKKKILTLAALISGFFCLATIQVQDYNSLLLIRFMTGIGLGATMPNLIAVACDAVSIRRRSTAIAVMFSGNPIGAAAMALVASLNSGVGNWQNIYYIVGLLTLLFVPLIWIFIPISGNNISINNLMVKNESIFKILFGYGRFLKTSILWLSFFCTLFLFFMMLHWLPILIVDLGLSHSQSEITQACFNFGGLFGTFAVGIIIDYFSKRVAVIVTYILILAGLIGISNSSGMMWLSFFISLLGFSALGASQILNVLAATCYPSSSRSTGIGAVVAVGQIGGIVGPAAAGQLFSIGNGATLIIGTSIPVAIIAAVAALIVLQWPDAID